MEGKEGLKISMPKSTLDMLKLKACLTRSTLGLMQSHVDAMKLTEGSKQTTMGPMQNKSSQDLLNFLIYQSLVNWSGTG
jgi:hypothetical protein